MAENSKKYLDINGLSYTLQQLKTKTDELYTTKEYVEESIIDCPRLNENGDLVIDGSVLADNIPKVVSENTLLTISAEVLQNAVDNQITILENEPFVADPSKPVYADFAGSTMTSTVVETNYIEFFVADPTMASGFAIVVQSGKDLAGDNPNKSKITLRVLKDLEITDLRLYQLEVNTMSSMCLEHDLNVVNSISMGRRGNIGQFSVALGGSCVASGQYSIAAGLASSATGPMAVALGRGCSATGTAGLSTGQMCIVGQEGFATGRQSKANGRAASALGNYCVAKGTYSLAEGDNCQANGSTSHAEGYYTIAGSAYQHVQGKYNISDTKSTYSHIVGNGTADNARSNAHTLDWDGNAWFAGDITLGADNIKVATENDALLKTAQSLTDAEKDQVRANLGYIGRTGVVGTQHTIDGKTYTVEPNAEIFGDYVNNIAIGQWSIAEGSENIAIGKVSHVEGAMNKAIGMGNHVEGIQCTASGYWSHAEGERTIVSSYASHAEGSFTNMPNGTVRYGTASGYASHIEGGGCHASGSCAHAEGLATDAAANHSHAEGRYTIAAGAGQHVEGRGNIADTESNYIHIAGNGDWPSGAAEPTRSNAYTLDWDGNGWFAGTVKVGADNKELATQEYVNNAVSGLVDSAPETLNTLNELAAALKNDPNHAETMLTEIGKKANTADLHKVATTGNYNDLKNKPTIKKSDWGENDTSDASYIYGRTHWHEVVYGPDMEQGLIAQAIDKYSYGTEDTICYDVLLEAADGRPKVFLDVGETYTIVVKNKDDGSENTYQCMCDYHPYMAETYVLGDEQFTEMPIVIIYELENVNFAGFSAAMLNEGTYDIQVFGSRSVKREVYHKLSMDYLPNNVATKEYVDDSIAANTAEIDDAILDAILQDLFGTTN